MKVELSKQNVGDLEWIAANAGTPLDLAHFQVQVMLEYLIGDDNQDAFNQYFNERVATLVKAAKQQVTTALLRAGRNGN